MVEVIVFLAPTSVEVFQRLVGFESQTCLPTHAIFEEHRLHERGFLVKALDHPRSSNDGIFDLDCFRFGILIADVLSLRGDPKTFRSPRKREFQKGWVGSFFRLFATTTLAES